jgi:hypothetical protein
MINEPLLQEVLVSISKKLRANGTAQTALLTETAAIRDTLKELFGDRFSAVFERYQVSQMAKLVPIESSVNQLNDLLIERSKDVVAL